MTAISGLDLLWPIVAAPFIGSFSGVLITRLPASEPIFLSRSACEHCGTRLGPTDLIPLVSFCFLRGRCRHCGQPIGLFYPAVEIAAVGIALWAALVDAEPIRLWIDCGLGWTLLALGWIDWNSLLLPDALTLTLLLAGLLRTFIQTPDALADHCLAAILAWFSLRALALTYRRLRGRDGLGGGDEKLLAAAGAWCGLEALPFIVLTSAILGLLAAAGLAAGRGGMTFRTQIPFGPCIAAALWLGWLHGGLIQDLQQLLGDTG